ncbi:hypothetical protein ABKA04_003404 [Annulohypoxylon sp. FPYF3050]
MDRESFPPVASASTPLISPLQAKLVRQLDQGESYKEIYSTVVEMGEELRGDPWVAVEKSIDTLENDRENMLLLLHSIPRPVLRSIVMRMVAHDFHDRGSSNRKYLYEKEGPGAYIVTLSIMNREGRTWSAAENVEIVRLLRQYALAIDLCENFGPGSGQSGIVILTNDEFDALETAKKIDAAYDKPARHLVIDENSGSLVVSDEGDTPSPEISDISDDDFEPDETDSEKEGSRENTQEDGTQEDSRDARETQDEIIVRGSEESSVRDSEEESTTRDSEESTAYDTLDEFREDLRQSVDSAGETADETVDEGEIEIPVEKLEMPTYAKGYKHKSLQVTQLASMLEKRAWGEFDPTVECSQSVCMVGNAGDIERRTQDHRRLIGGLRNSAATWSVLHYCLKYAGLEVEETIIPVCKAWAPKQINAAETLVTVLAGSLISIGGLNVKQPGTRSEKEMPSKEIFQMCKRQVWRANPWFEQNMEKSYPEVSRLIRLGEQVDKSDLRQDMPDQILRIKENMNRLLKEVEESVNRGTDTLETAKELLELDTNDPDRNEQLKKMLTLATDDQGKEGSNEGIRRERRDRRRPRRITSDEEEEE